MAGTNNTLGRTNVDAIRDQVNGISLGPPVTENGGHVLDVSQMSPEAAGNALNAQFTQALQVTQAQQAQMAQQMQETQAQNAQLMQGLASAIQSIGASVAQPTQIDPTAQYALTQEDVAELGTLHDPVNKATNYAAERVKQEVNQQTQQLVNQYSTETNTKIQQLESELANTRKINEMNFRTQLDTMAMQYGINMNNLNTNPQWQALLQQPVSGFDNTLIGQRVESAVKNFDIGFFSKLFQQFAQMHGGTARVDGIADASQPNTAAQMGMQQVSQANVPPGGFQQPAINSQTGADLREIDAAFQQIEEQRDNLKRQLFDERSITREDFADQSSQLMQLEAQLVNKRNALMGQAA